MKRLLLLSLAIAFVYPRPTSAIYDPASVPNNKYGIHVADLNDISGASGLVNSSGGDWGYVTIVMTEQQKHHSLWQDIFNRMRREHVIPIVRLATGISGSSWSEPLADQAEDWARFLHALNWPTENRYVAIFNEPNHAKEWGGKVSPERYADVFSEFSRTLKSKSGDFFVLPAALDSSANNSADTMDATLFWNRMVSRSKDIFSLMDGWNSHSYPNPGFAGSPMASGRGTVRSYQWELSFLSGLGLDRKLPVFITETGWNHSAGKSFDPGLPRPETVAGYIQYAFHNVWSDPAIVAVTPFVYNYQDTPFDHFSWLSYRSDGVYPFHETYRLQGKTAGKPRQRDSIETKTPLFPPTLVSGSSYEFDFRIANTGQSIISTDEGFRLGFTVSPGLEIKNVRFDPIEPGSTGIFRYAITTPENAGKYRASATLGRTEGGMAVGEGFITVVPPPSLSISAQAAWKKRSDLHDVTVLVYDIHDRIVHRLVGQKLVSGIVTVDKLKGIVPGDSYRIVLLVPGYLPRQQETILVARNTGVAMKRLLPVDFNGDGTLSMEDLPAMFRLSPARLRDLFI